MRVEHKLLILFIVGSGRSFMAIGMQLNASGDEYANYVHEGTRFMPGRPFTDDVSDMAFSFSETISAKLY
jgi:hypothetical protein